jgi:hypothetical protein
LAHPDLKDEALDQLDPRPPASVPARELELSTYLSRLHGRVQHHRSASECETIPMDALLAMAEADDMHRWNTLSLGYTDPLGAPWLREAAAAGYELVTERDLVCFGRNCWTWPPTGSGSASASSTSPRDSRLSRRR